MVNTVIVIRCTLPEGGDGITPCIHEDCSKCQLLAAQLKNSPFEVLGEADEWK